MLCGRHVTKKRIDETALALINSPYFPQTKSLVNENPNKTPMCITLDGTYSGRTDSQDCYVACMSECDGQGSKKWLLWTNILKD